MPDTKYIKAEHSTRGQVGVLWQTQTDGPDREGSHSSIAQAGANTNTSQDDAAVGTSDGSKHLHRAHGGVTLSSLAVGRCETFDEEGGKLGSCSRIGKV